MNDNEQTTPVTSPTKVGEIRLVGIIMSDGTITVTTAIDGICSAYAAGAAARMLRIAGNNLIDELRNYILASNLGDEDLNSLMEGYTTRTNTG